MSEEEEVPPEASEAGETEIEEEEYSDHEEGGSRQKEARENYSLARTESQEDGATGRGGEGGGRKEVKWEEEEGEEKEEGKGEEGVKEEGKEGEEVEGEEEEEEEEVEEEEEEEGEEEEEEEGEEEEEEEEEEEKGEEEEEEEEIEEEEEEGDGRAEAVQEEEEEELGAELPLKSHELRQLLEPEHLGTRELGEAPPGTPGQAQGLRILEGLDRGPAAASASVSTSTSSSSTSVSTSTFSESSEDAAGVAGLSEKSHLLATHRDLLAEKDSRAPVTPLTMDWTYGWNSSLPVFYIRDVGQKMLLYASGHTAIIYDVVRDRQYHLQGHPNTISCLCVSEDRRWVATADKGPECLIIVWDSYSGIPVHTIFDSCPQGNGIRSIAMSHDAKFLATISDDEIQKVCIWRWTLAVETPACCLCLPAEYGLQNYITFNPRNDIELVSNSKTRTVYYFWDEGETLLHSAPLLTVKTFNKLVGKFSQSVFHLAETQVLSATYEGKLVVWDISRPTPSAPGTGPILRPCKLVHLQKEGITVLTTVDSYIVTGDVKGNIKFYDRSLSIINWYSGFKLSSIRALSFARTPAAPPLPRSEYPADCTLAGDRFVVRNFIIGTSDATIYHLTTDGTKLEKVLFEPRDAICAVCCHPYQPLVTIGSFCGMIKVWNYEKKSYLFSRVFEKGLGVQSLSYNPEGGLLGVGFTDGTVHILDSMSLENEVPQPFHYSRSSVTHISFSYDSQYMATADVSFTVAVYKVVVSGGLRVWEYLARLRSHRKSIRTVLFGIHLDNNEPRLLTLGVDRLLIEYDLLRSYKDHLEVLDIHRTDQGHSPTCMVWYPPLSKELFLLVCNSGYKIRLFNSTTKMCRKTLLGPVFGSPVQQVQVVPVKAFVELQRRYLVFINRDKVGIQILPVDGNPHKTCAMVCHPGGVSSMSLSYEGRYVFTAGGHDRSVVQWRINLSVLDAAVSLGGKDLAPFYSLVFGGREGKFYRELENYFYYSQLRSQGIDTTDTRKVSEHIALSELPFIMRAIGFYPSEEKIENMFNEIRFGEYVETGKLIDKIDLPDFLRLYVNHRPPFGNTFSDIQASFDTLGHTNAQGQKAIRREDFLTLLLTRGEHMTEEELRDCLTTLCGLNPEGWRSEPPSASLEGSQEDSEFCYKDELPEEITAEIFTTEILGLTLPQDDMSQ